MCGLSGIASLTLKQLDLPSVQSRMLSIQRHRGPDQEGAWNDDQVCLVHNRLSIIDLTEAGRQPMISHSGRYVIAYNGEVYNYKDLQKVYLKDVEFRGHSDTEVLLELLEKKGIEIVKELNGMFAFALWDTQEKTLTLCRDHIGVKPLYWCIKNGVLYFASEIKTILAGMQRIPGIDPNAVENYFTFCHALAPNTIYEGIFKLPPGHIMTWKNGECSTPRRYWQSVPANDGMAKSLKSMESAVINKTEMLFESAVKRQLVGDVDVGVFLSGGLDSSGIVAFASRHYPRKIKTFSVGFDYQGYNELDDARTVARAFGTDHHELMLSDVDLIPVLEKLVYHYDEPFGDAAAFPTYLLSEFARKQVKVGLSGEGGDEIFGGYNRYVAEAYAQKLLCFPLTSPAAHISKGLAAIIPRLRRTKKILDTLTIQDPVKRYGEMLSFFNNDQLTKLLARPLNHSPQDEAYGDLWKIYCNYRKGCDMVNWLLYADQSRWMPETYLEKVDKVTMAVSLETRVPMLDIDLVTYVNSLPGSFKVQGRQKKVLLRKMLSRHLPDRIINKPKHGFSVPTDIWFRGRLNDFTRDTINASRSDLKDMINFAYVDTIIDRHKKGLETFDSHIWLVLMFCLWNKTKSKYIEKN